MGAGFAKECKEYDLSLPKRFGKIIQKIAYKRTLGLFYGLFVSEDMYFGAIQTKYHWKYPSPKDLISESLGYLFSLSYILPYKNFHLTRPGCGNGGLNWENDVKYMFQNMPHNVFIWNKA